MDVTEVEGATLYCADALEALRHLPDSSIDLIATDPPYYRVKGLGWDRAWDTSDGFLAWMAQLVDEWQRVLKPNGSLYCFASPRMASRVEVEIGRRLNVLHQIVWVKPDPKSELNQGAGKGGLSCKESLRSFFPNTERIIFAEHFDSDSVAKGEFISPKDGAERNEFIFDPLRKWFLDEKERLGVTVKELNIAIGASTTGSGVAGHYFKKSKLSQWRIPTQEHYEKLKNIGFSRSYESIKREYDQLQAEYNVLRRPFYVTENIPYTDVWSFKTVPHRPGKHVCEKPLDLCEHIILVSSRPGSVVLDSFVGSGAFGHAAVKHGRTFIGSDNDPHWIAKAAERIRKVNAVEPEKRTYQQMDLAI